MADLGTYEPAIGGTDRAARSISWLLGLLLVYVTATNIDRARHRHFWYDEVSTVTIARLPTMSAVRDALADGGDGTPPGFFLVERALSGLVGDEQIGYRLVSIASLSLTCLCLFVFVRPRTSSVSALAAALVPLMTILYRGYEPGTASHETLAYGIEARPYAAVVFCLALGLVAWQRLARLPWLVVFSVALGAAISLHYYAGLAFVLFGFAEACRTLLGRTFRLRVWMALAVAALPLVWIWPLLQRLREYYAGTPAATASMHDAIASYDQFLSIRPVGVTMGVVVALSAALFISVRARFKGDRGLDGPGDECGLVAGFLWLPWLGFAVAVLGGGGLLPRYTIGTILGLAVAAGFVSHWMGRRAAVWLLSCLLAAFVSREVIAWRTELAGRNLPLSNLATLDAMLDRGGRPPLPIVVTNAGDFMSLAYYGRPDLRLQLTFLLGANAVRRRADWDTFELNLSALARHLPARVVSYDEFSRTYDTYLLFVTSGAAGAWWPERLVDDGRLLQVLEWTPGCALYLVKRGAA